MKRWSWVLTAGNRGEMPVQILVDSDAEFVINFAAGARITSYRPPEQADLRPGDVCIVRGEVLALDTETDPVDLTVDIFSVDEFIRRGDRHPPSEVDAMMAHLDAAKEYRRQERAEKGCKNCNPIDSDTGLSIETQIQNRDLHYCAECDRLLSTKEYEHWKSIHRW